MIRTESRWGEKSVWLKIATALFTPIFTAMFTTLVMTHVMQQVMAEQIRQLKENLTELKSEMRHQDELCGRNYDRLNEWIIRHGEKPE